MVPCYLLGSRCTHSVAQLLKKDLNICQSLYNGNVIVELEKNTNMEFNRVYGACNLTK